jgi:predicted lipoprotein with Yx(FWY)xxD motif
MIKSISIALAIAGMLAVAGCGSSSNSSSSGEGGAYGGGEESTAASKEAKSEAGATTPAVLSVGSAPEVGKVIVDSKGFTLYYFEKDQGGKSACYGACAKAWPPYTGTPKAEGGAMSSEMGTTKRSDGTVQVTYAGWPLYTFEGDSKPGEANGTDSKAFGASWYPLHPNGEKAGH